MKIKLPDLYILCFLIGLALSALPGCDTANITGGQVHENTGSFELLYDLPGGGTLTITDSRNTTQTTQPSVKATGNHATPAISATTQPNDLSGVSFNPLPIVRKTFADKYAWALASVFILCAVGLFYMNKYLMGTVALACGVLSALNPIAMMIGGIVVLGVTIYMWIRDMNQAAAGIQAAAATSPNASPNAMLDRVRTHVDNSAQKTLRLKP